MSTPTANSTDLFHENEQQAFRLLELPPDVLSIINSEQNKLVLKSSGNVTTSSLNEAVLCSKSKTWALRHVQSSNALLLASPHSANTSDSTIDSAPSLSLISSCNGTIEVVELKEASAKLKSPKDWLLESLPVYEKDGLTTSRVVSRNDVLEKIPFSEDEIDEAWRGLAAFDLNDMAFLPSNDSTLNMWTDMVREASILSIDLTREFSVEDLWNESSLSDKHPHALFLSLISKLSAEFDPNVIESARLHRDKTLVYVGELLVSTTPGVKRQNVEGWLDQWRNLLPKPWQERVSEGMLMDLEAFQTRASGSAKTADLSTDAGIDSKRKANTRNWHEKFKRTKKET